MIPPLKKKNLPRPRLPLIRLTPLPPPKAKPQVFRHGLPVLSPGPLGPPPPFLPPQPSIAVTFFCRLERLMECLGPGLSSRIPPLSFILSVSPLPARDSSGGDTSLPFLCLSAMALLHKTGVGLLPRVQKGQRFGFFFSDPIPPPIQRKHRVRRPFRAAHRPDFTLHARASFLFPPGRFRNFMFPNLRPLFFFLLSQGYRKPVPKLCGRIPPPLGMKGISLSSPPSRRRFRPTEVAFLLKENTICLKTFSGFSIHSGPPPPR